MRIVQSLAVLPAEFRYPAQPDFFRTVEWFSCLQDTVFCEEPFTETRAYVEGNSALIVRTRGRRVESMTNYYTLEYRVGTHADQLIDMLARDRPTSVHLRYLPAADSLIIAGALRQAGFYVRPYFMYENWHVQLKGRSFADFMRDRPSQLTNTLRRRRKKLEAAHRVEIHLERTPARLADFLSVYQRSWKRTEPYPNFIPTLAATCARMGTLRIGTLYVDDQPAAAQLWITTTRKAIIYKLAYDERFKEHSVGSILSSAMFREAIDVDGVAEIDYGVGSEPYKRDWMEDVRRIEGLAAYNRSTIAGAVGAAIEGAKSVASAIRGRIAT